MPEFRMPASYYDPPEPETTCRKCGVEMNYGECEECGHYNESPEEARERELEEKADSEENIYGRRRWWRNE